MMKVLHITTMGHGGAGIAARRIHNALLRKGVESSMLVRFKQAGDDTMESANPNMGLYQPASNPVTRKLEQALRRRGKRLTKVEQFERQILNLDRQYGAAYTMPVSNYDLSTHPLVQQADIIHLHWVENFLDYPTFFARVKKPIIWTFHDENVAYGGFHYSDEAERLKEPYSPVENEFLKIKRQALTEDLNIHFVALSRMMEQFYHQKGVAPHYPVEVIHNGIEPDQFQLLDRDYCRQILGIPPDRKALCFCASDINDAHKGLSILVKTLEAMNRSDMMLVCVGKGVLPKCSFPVMGTGAIANPHLLSVVYSASDLFIMPSLQEAFAQTPLEAMACGCPVVAFPCGVIDELVDETNGVRCDDFSEKALADGIADAINRPFNRRAIRESAIGNFNIDRIAQQYIDLYKRCR